MEKTTDEIKSVCESAMREARRAMDDKVYDYPTTQQIIAAFADLGYPTSDSVMDEIERRCDEWGRDDYNAPNDMFWILFTWIMSGCEIAVPFDCEETVRIR